MSCFDAVAVQSPVWFMSYIARADRAECSLGVSMQGTNATVHLLGAFLRVLAQIFSTFGFWPFLL